MSDPAVPRMPRAVVTDRWVAAGRRARSATTPSPDARRGVISTPRPAGRDDGAMSAAPSDGDRDAAGRDGGWTASLNALGGFIRAQRQLANLSLREMAAMTSVSNAYLSQVERGLHQPSLKVLHSIADALQLSTEQLLDHAGLANGTPRDSGPPAGGTEEAIRNDPRLSPEQRTALLGVYRSFVDKG